LPSFNDDIQGTGAVVAAAILAAGRATGVALEDQRVLFVGAGAAGVGIARQLRSLSVPTGSAQPATLALFDTQGLVVDDRPELEDHKLEFASSPAAAAAMGLKPGQRNDLARVVEAFAPTVIVGTTGEPGVFDQKVITAVAGQTERPLVMALSNPTSKTEGLPADIVDWTGGRGLIATGSPFDPVEYQGRTIPVSQANNVYVFPGVGLGAIVSGASEVNDAMFAAAAETLALQVADTDLASGALYPPVTDLRSISRHIAAAVARAARDTGVADDLSDDDIEAALDREIWDLEYPRLQPG